MVGRRQRDQATANSGIVIELQLRFQTFLPFGALAGMEFQSIEQNAWHWLGKSKLPTWR
jgi:hypothetical protein